MILSRRSLITGLVSFVAAPAIVRATSIMPVKAWPGIPNFDPSSPDYVEVSDYNMLKYRTYKFIGATWTPAPGWRFRYDEMSSVLYHEPDPDAALAA